jgi:hypothetical protein
MLHANAASTEWVSPNECNGTQRWGIRGHLQFGVYPGALSSSGTGGPRGLLRIWYPALPQGKYCLVNFIAIEPVVAGHGKGFSELEKSEDGKNGKVIVAVGPATIEKLPRGGKALRLHLQVERFHNGAHISLILTQREKRPDELEFQIHAEPDSAPLKECTLTATWGNITRSRYLWLKDDRLDSRRVYRGYHASGFASDLILPLDRLTVLPDRSAIVAMTTDEVDPASVYPAIGTDHFHYGGVPVTQYWRKPRGADEPQLHVRVNGRRVYWNSHQVIPGGIAFENFELRSPFHEGEKFIFGITEGGPETLGIGEKRAKQWHYVHSANGASLVHD